MESKPLDNVTVLLVEDEVQLLEATSVLLELEGANVIKARGGFEAFKTAIEKAPDIVVSDLRMPEGDGKDLCIRLREAGVDTPIICVTAYTDYLESEILSWGATAQFTKPLSINKLVSAIKNLLH